MWRRLYLTFPDREHARQMSDELQREGFDRDQLHAMDRDSAEIPGLPPTTNDQQHDRIWFWEQLYWNGNLALFGVALVGFIVALLTAAYGWAIFTVAIMLATFVGGKHFASEVPHSHLNQMREPMSHGEVVLMVDMPVEQLPRAEAIAHRHPEAGGHVVGWAMRGMAI